MVERFTIVFKHDFKVFKRTNQLSNIRNPPVRIILHFRPMMTRVSPEDGKENSNGATLRSLLKSLRLKSFKDVTVICCRGMFTSGLENAKFLRYLEMKWAQNLQILAFRWCSLSEKFIFTLYQFLKQRYEDKKPIQYLQIFRLYNQDIEKLNRKRVGYLLSQTAIFCERYFHTQTNRDTNIDFYHYFFTAADICSRKNPPSKVSLGGQAFTPVGVFNSYSKLSKALRIYSNPSGWGQEWNNTARIKLASVM